MSFKEYPTEEDFIELTYSEFKPYFKDIAALITKLDSVPVAQLTKLKLIEIIEELKMEDKKLEEEGK